MGNKMKNLASTILIVCFSVLTGSLAACRVEAVSDSGGNLETIQEKTFQIQPGKNLKVEASTGDVQITTWDKSEVYIKILGNDNAREKVAFSFNNNDDEVTVIAKREGSFFSWFSGIKIKFEIKVPAEFNTNINTSGGDIMLGDIRGNNLLKTSGGDVWAKHTDGILKISTSGGEINLDSNSGEMNVSTSGGDIKARDFAGDISASTSGGDIFLKGSDAKIYAETSGGDVVLEYTGENKGIELETSGGDIQIKLPSNFNASANMHTSGGEIECDLTANNAKRISSTSFEADLNSGGEELTVKTSGGDIMVKKQ
jgi:DUF4097 and DUF4098 domain-containing protein YvlB